MKRTYSTTLQTACSEFGVCGRLESPRPRTLGEAVKAITQRFDRSVAEGTWPEKPLWLDP